MITNEIDNASTEQQKLEFKLEEIVVGGAVTDNENKNKKEIKTSDYDSLSNSIVDNLLCKLSTDAELYTAENLKNSSNVEENNKNNISDFVFEECKKVIDERDKGNISKISQGQYYGQAQHRDGSMLPIIFEVCMSPSGIEPLFNSNELYYFYHKVS